MKNAGDILAVVSGIAISATAYYQPIEGTWLGHDSWAAQNLRIAGFIAAPCGVLLFWLRRHIWRSVLAALTVVFLLIFIVSAFSSIYLSGSVPIYPNIADQVFYRDVVWKNAHLAMLISATLLVYSAFAYRSTTA
ncbi:hypothetical protein [Sinorhizobium meliloti]|uniref:hypothetical protein n=1 Tax=Rhizobium meliloti TaxID=382 RepID=UPI000B497262|nr:hypothetical protein [Sinorhizobium meliloti]ASP55447.1 hypothetical protein CDO31_29325 [Sinorhizobium meliloti]